jgi:tetratricopeptide (TPR) repeat protein
MRYTLITFINRTSPRGERLADHFDIFLSHNSRDKPVVEEIGTWLGGHGLRVWLDKWELRPGFPWQEGLEAGVQASKAVAVLVGADGLGAWQEPEMRAFIARSNREPIPVIPVLLPDSPDSPQLTLFLEAFTWVDLRQGLTEDGLAQLLWGITGKKPLGMETVAATSSGNRKRPGVKVAAPGRVRGASAGRSRILIVARDLEDQPLSGFRFAYGGVESKSTNKVGATELDLPPDHRTGQQIKIRLSPGSKRAKEWFLVNPQVNIPSESGSAEVVLMRRSGFRQVAAEARDAPSAKTLGASKPTAEDRKRALVEAGERHGLTADQPQTALHSFADTQDPKDRGIAALLEGHYGRAEELLKGPAENNDVEALRHMGAAQFYQAKYRPAAESFRKALALRGEDTDLLSWLGISLRELAEWAEAEPLMRRALAIAEKKYGPEHPNVAIALDNLALLLQVTNHLGEAEPLMRRALIIAEKRHWPEHPEVARALNNLAQLLQATNRLAEAEPLMRRALAIAETRYGPEHPNVATVLSNLGQLLWASSRLSEAESLMRRALAIDEKTNGPDHPRVATDLNNLAQLLKATDRLAEAEPLMRRALAIDEKRYGPKHPKVAIRLNNLATLLGATQRLSEAEPLMRRALAIDEQSYGLEHPNVAAHLNNLAQLLETTNRLAEAEPLVRRALAIDEKSYGPEHPEVATDLNILARLLEATNRLAEAEPMMRRALAIDENSYGPEHSRVANDLSNLAMLLQDTNRLAEAEPMMRRALAIDVESYGSEHPDVARDLNNLAELLQATNRLAEAEPLMHRALAVLVMSDRHTGHEHPQQGAVSENYRQLLRAMGKPETEIESTMEALIHPPR